MSTPAETLAQSLAKLQTANRIDGSRASYRKDSPAEYIKVIAYLQGGARPSGVVSDMGMGLVFAEDARRGLVVVPPPPPPPPPPPSGTPIPANGIITSGGVYSGTYTGTPQIKTTQPVSIVNSLLTPRGGDLVIAAAADSADVDLTLDHVEVDGGTGRLVYLRNFKRYVERNCTVEKTSGRHLIWGRAGSTVQITRSKHKNLQGPNMGAAQYAQFVQLGEVQNSAIDISWNEIINEFGLSEVEDVISVFKTAYSDVHNNYIQGGYPLTNTASSSANGITVELGDDLGPWSHHNQVHDNQVINNAGGIGLVGGHDNTAHNNRVVNSALLDNGDSFRASNLGFAIWRIGGYSHWANNHAHGNVVGYMHRDGFRNDYWFPDAPADCRALNTSLPGPITKATERAEWDRWLAKLTANGITVGA